MRALVQEPMKTRSTWISSIGVPGSSAMYASDCRAESPWAGSAKLSGSGTLSPTVTDCAGLVPHVTYGSSSAASITSVRS